MLVYRNLYEIGIQDRNLTIRNISIIRNSTVMNMEISVGYIRITNADAERIAQGAFGFMYHLVYNIETKKVVTFLPLPK